MKHSPSPWHVERKVHIYSAGEIIIANCPPANESGSVDARLIAAAPDLVKALRACIKVIDEEVHAGAGDSHPIIKAHAKVAKAARAALARAGVQS